MTAHRRLLLIACVAALATGARAEAPAGVLTGHVFDQTGSPLRGVVVTVARKPPETLAKKARTNDEGAFRIAGLPQGMYDVTASAPKLRTLTKRDLSVMDGPIAELDLIMEVEAVVERIGVVEKAPLVSASRATVKEDFELDCGFPGSPRTRDSLVRVADSAAIEDGVVLARGWRLDRDLLAERATDNPFLGSREHPLSTFSIDVDTAAYADVRRYLENGIAPPPDAVRIEELVSSFPYSYPAATGEDPFSVTFEVNDCPWNGEARLVRIGLRGRERSMARDVTLQVELNPARVVAYRLIGHENRMLGKADFHDDRKGSGELGAGETVTALYEIIPPSPKGTGDISGAERLRYGGLTGTAGESWDLLTVKVRYKLGRWFSQERAWSVQDAGAHLPAASVDFRFAAAVAAFGMILRDSPHRGTADADLVLQLAGNGLGPDLQGRRRDFLQLVRQSRDILADRAALSHR
jgi:hypothetical protein